MELVVPMYVFVRFTPTRRIERETDSTPETSGISTILSM